MLLKALMAVMTPRKEYQVKVEQRKLCAVVLIDEKTTCNALLPG